MTSPVLTLGDGATSDEHGTTAVRIVLERVGGDTKLALAHVGLPADSPGGSGWIMAFDKLAVYMQQLV